MTAATRYSTGAIVLHWLIALALAGQLALGFAMPHDASGFALIQLHKSVGIAILLLSLLRLGWRFTHTPPAPLEGGWEGALAKVVHVGLYVFMIGAPLTGWALVSSDRNDIPTLLFGTVPWPHLPLGEAWNGAAGEAHELLAFFGIALFALHVAGALRHHLLLKDGLLARMSPRGGGGFVLAMLAAVLLLGAGVFFGLGGPAAEEHDHTTDHAPQAVEEGAALADDGHDHVHEDAGETEDEAAVEEEAEDEPVAEEEEAEPQAAGPPPSWAIQPGGSLRFSVTNAGSALNGSFGQWSGDIAMDPDAPASAAITIRVDLASATLGDATQDTMLRGADFLDSSAFPQAVWRSSSVRRVSGNRYEADGTLSLKGASHPQRISFTLSGSGSRRSVEGSASIDRNAFAVGTGSSAENLAGTVQLNFAFDAQRR